MKLISVIIPLYKPPHFILRALKSVLSQTVKPDEILVVDDGSPFGGADVVQSLQDQRIRLIRQENSGVSVARNRGISEASGEIIAFLDDDDEWKPNYLETILAMCELFPHAGAYATAYEIISPFGEKITKNFHVISPGNKQGLIMDYLKVAIHFPIFMSATSVPKKVLEEIGGFAPGEDIDQDVDVWLKISLKYPLAWSSECLVIWHQEASHRVLGNRRWYKEPAISRTAREAIAGGKVPPEKLADLREYVAHFQVNAARDCLVQGQKETARQLLEYARGTRKFAQQWWQWRILAALPGRAAPWLWRLKQSGKHWW
ncbi:MAG: glycosyltransferase family 2 protein [Thermodesulfobacteriota bacterium]